MERDLAAYLATHAELSETSPSTTIRPGKLDLEEALALLGRMAGAPLLASVQLKPGPVIGEGGMGVVRSAEQVALGRTVAIKTLRDGRRSPEAAQDLLREAWVTGSLEHPNIVPVHHLGLDDTGMPAIILKRVEGVEWSKLVGDAAEVKRRFGATDLLAWNLSILMQVLNAIRFAHSRGIVHRDLKPANVMIGDFGEVYLLDWGIAVSLRDDTDGRVPLASQVRSIAGTPFYMAPEMLAPDGDVPLSERTDVYLAGAVLHEIVTGRPPHRGRTAIEVMTSVLTFEPELAADVPAELASIIARALARDPADRFDSAEAVRLALQSFLEHRGSDQLVVRASARLDELVTLLATSPSAVPADRQRHREEVYRLFGACRFGFHEALAAWHESATARDGVRRATIAIAEYELTSGNANAAVSLLSELEDPPALLERARGLAAQEADRQHRLQQLQHAHDLAVGRRQRGRLGVVLGSLFTIAPLAARYQGTSLRSYVSYIGWSLTVLVLSLVWVWRARHSLTTTLVNRRLLGAIAFLLVAQVVLLACSWQAEVPLARTEVQMLFLYFIIAGSAAMTTDVALWPSAVGYGVAFAYASYQPAAVSWMLAAGSAVFTLNTLVAWRLARPDAGTA